MTEADDFPTRVITVLGSCPHELVPKVSEAVRTPRGHVRSLSMLGYVKTRQPPMDYRNMHRFVFSLITGLVGITCVKEIKFARVSEISSTKNRMESMNNVTIFDDFGHVKKIKFERIWEIWGDRCLRRLILRSNFFIIFCFRVLD